MFLVVHIHPIWIQRPLNLNLTPILHFLQRLLLCPHLLSYIFDQYRLCLLQDLTWGLDLGRQVYARVFTRRPWGHKARVFMAAQRAPAITSTCGDSSARNSLETDPLVVRQGKRYAAAHMRSCRFWIVERSLLFVQLQNSGDVIQAIVI